MSGTQHMTADHAGARSSPARQTAVFLATGAALLAAGWFLQPRFRPAPVKPEAERVLFPELADAAKAASLEIVSYDDELATLAPFKVAQSGGVWVLPAHENYPADAKEQLAAAATELVDRPILDVVSNSPGDHETYGVIEPDPEKIRPGMTGVGQLVEIRDASGNKLARLVVGKEDRRPAGGAAAGGRALRFVRKAGQDPVYRVELDTSKFTTKFDDWIEKDLLKLSPWDVRRVVIDDSVCTFGIDEASGRPAVSQDRRSRIAVRYDDKNSTWSLEKLTGFDAQGKPEDVALADAEELASGKLNDLRNALGDLKIVDVARKPAGLSGDLKAEAKFTENREAVTSLAQRGFYPFASGEILSSNGETVVGMKDGVEYLLRFGNGVSVSGATQKSGTQSGGPASTGRYLFVTARFNESLLEKPTLEPVPDAPEADAVEKKDGAADKKPAGDQPAGDTKAADEDKKDGEAKPAETADDAEAKAQAALEERRRVERENRRKQEDYDAKVQAAQKRVRELNGRFADWYYVVPDAEFVKIHLDRAAVVQKKSTETKQD
jgi:hypothetical protein